MHLRNLRIPSAREARCCYFAAGCPPCGTMNYFPRLRFLAISSLGFIFASCASVTVKNVQNGNSARPTSKPAHIYVEKFSTARAEVKEHPMRKHRGQLAREAQELVASYLVQELSKSIAPASLVSGRPPRGGWLVSGDFTRINEGSRFLRMAFGLGMGGTKIETRVAVRNLPPQNPPFLQFSTTGGSGAQPGAATNPIPFSSAPTALLASKAGITDDAARTARMITAEIAGYAAKRGWIPASAVPVVKHER
jgi:hypothetical protein